MSTAIAIGEDITWTSLFDHCVPWPQQKFELALAIAPPTCWNGWIEKNDAYFHTRRFRQDLKLPTFYSSLHPTFSFFFSWPREFWKVQPHKQRHGWIVKPNDSMVAWFLGWSKRGTVPQSQPTDAMVGQKEIQYPYRNQPVRWSAKQGYNTPMAPRAIDENKANNNRSGSPHMRVHFFFFV